MTAETVTDHLTASIREGLPTVLARREAAFAPEARIQWDEPTVMPCQVVALTDFPAVEVVLLADAVVGHVIDDDTGYVYDRVAYTLRIFGTVHGPDYEATDRARKRLATALKELLVTLPDVGRVIRTSYSQVGADRDRRTLAAVYLDAVLTVTEDPVAPDAAAAPDPHIEHVVAIAQPEH